MTRSDFEAMSRKDLRAYILENREDEEAFHVYMDRALAKPGELHPAPKSLDDLKHFPQLQEQRRRQLEQES